MSKKEETHRGLWSSNMGFLLSAAGSAIGLGNLWKFPYLVGKYGGGAFIIVYLILVVVLGVSIVIAEITIGRHGGTDAYGSFAKVKKGWGIFGFIAILTCFFILSYYSVIAGWVLRYIVQFATTTSGDFGAFFKGFISSPIEPIIYAAVILVITSFIVARGIAGGIEKANKILMPLLFVFIIFVAVRVMTLDGAAEGLKFYFKPDFSKISGESILAALGQVFFSLSLGMGILITYGSYASKKTNIPKTSLTIVDLDTLIALLAGLAIIPAVFIFGQEPAAGPKLIFIVLPQIFATMPFGQFFGLMFFALVFFAALTSTISLMEVVVAYVVDQFKFKRSSAVILISLKLFFVAIFCSLSFGPIEKFTPFFGKNVFDFLDFLTSNIFLPIGGIAVCLLTGWVFGAKALEAELTNNGTVKFKLIKVWMFMMKFGGPVILLAILLNAIGILKF
ncbi:MAG: sodium-dependent transporter [Fusobacteriaceae bacterium]